MYILGLRARLAKSIVTYPGYFGVWIVAEFILLAVLVVYVVFEFSKNERLNS